MSEQNPEPLPDNEVTLDEQTFPEPEPSEPNWVDLPSVHPDDDGAIGLLVGPETDEHVHTWDGAGA